MRDYDVFDLRTIYAKQAQTNAGVAQQLTTPALGGRCIKSGVYDNRVVAVACHQKKIAQGRGARVRTPADEDLGAVAHCRGVANRIKLVRLRLIHRNATPPTAPGISRSPYDPPRPQAVPPPPSTTPPTRPPSNYPSLHPTPRHAQPLNPS